MPNWLDLSQARLVPVEVGECDLEPDRHYQGLPLRSASATHRATLLIDELGKPPLQRAARRSPETALAPLRLDLLHQHIAHVLHVGHVQVEGKDQPHFGADEDKENDKLGFGDMLW